MNAVQFPTGTAGERDKDKLLAVIDNYTWVSRSAKLEEALNARLDPDGPGGDDPDPDWNAALEAISVYGGKMIKHVPPESPPEGAVL